MPVAEDASVPAGSLTRLALQVQIPANLHIQSNKPLDPFLIPATLTIDAPDGLTVEDITFPPSKPFRIAGFDELQTVFEGELLIGVRVRVSPDRPAGPLQIPGRLRVQSCTELNCYAPQTIPASWTLTVTPAGTPVARNAGDLFGRIDFSRAEAPPAVEPASPPAVATAPSAEPGDVLQAFDAFTVLNPRNPGGYMGVDDFLAFVDDAEAGRSGSPFAGRGPMAILALAFLGGIALNLTPCVLPMIPINLAIIGAGSQRAGRRRGFLLGAAYGGAMALVYGVLGLVVVLTAGTFGAINASPWFNFAIAALFVVLGLAMFDVLFSIDLSRFSSDIRFSQQSRGTFLLAFGMGAVAALLAGACVAPVVIQVVIFAEDLYARGTVEALALPFVLGLGMALPWPIAGAGFSALPKPGAWMVRVKQAMGAFILLMAAYYAYVGYGIVANRSVDPAEVRAGVAAQVEAGWYSSLSDGLRVARERRAPVLVDFWASWCKNCLVMDKTTLSDPRVRERLKDYVLVKAQSEDLGASPTRELLARIGAVGLPAYAILRPDAD
jgi:cytochrome c biogenesis protein CcdA